jgi:hypothetical protein
LQRATYPATACSDRHVVHRRCLNSTGLLLRCYPAHPCLQLLLRGGPPAARLPPVIEAAVSAVRPLPLKLLQPETSPKLLAATASEILTSTLHCRCHCPLPAATLRRPHGPRLHHRPPPPPPPPGLTTARGLMGRPGVLADQAVGKVVTLICAT